MCDASKQVQNYAMYLLGRRDYGTQELRERLLRPHPKREPPDEAHVEAALERLTELGLVNDGRRAERLAESLRRKGWGTRRIRMELRQRGLPEPDESPEGDSETIARLLQTKYAAKLRDEQGRGSVVQALMRRGFCYADIRSAMNCCDDNTYDAGDFE